MGKTNMDLTLKFIENGKHRFCDACHLSYDDCSTQCNDVGHFEYKKEVPEKIQTEYEWKKERCDLLIKHDSNNYSHDEIDAFGEEVIILSNWLISNKPFNWVQCTRENTKVGDVVRLNNDRHQSATVEHILRDSLRAASDCVMFCDWSYPSNLNRYEININR